MKTTKNCEIIANIEAGLRRWHVKMWFIQYKETKVGRHVINHTHTLDVLYDIQLLSTTTVTCSVDCEMFVKSDFCLFFVLICLRRAF